MDSLTTFLFVDLFMDLQFFLFFTFLLWDKKKDQEILVPFFLFCCTASTSVRLSVEALQRRCKLQARVTDCGA